MLTRCACLQLRFDRLSRILADPRCKDVPAGPSRQGEKACAAYALNLVHDAPVVSMLISVWGVACRVQKMICWPAWTSTGSKPVRTQHKSQHNVARRNPKPETRNLKPETRNPKPDTRHGLALRRQSHSSPSQTAFHFIPWGERRRLFRASALRLPSSSPPSRC